MINDYVVLDLETTGLNPKTDKIIEIGAAKVRNGLIVESFSTFINPGRSLTPRVMEITGIHNEDLTEAPSIDEIIDRLIDFIGEDILLGQNILFDFSFVKKAAVNKKIAFEKQGIDTLRIARRFLTDLDSRTLSSLCEHYHIEFRAHRAYNDAEATHKLYQALVKDFYEKEQDTFEPRQLIYQVKKEGPVTKKQIEQLQKLAVKYDIKLIEGKVLCPDNRVILDKQDIYALTKNEASRLIDHLLSNYGR